jgi:hypothetical protein
MLSNHLHVVVYGDAFGVIEAGRYPREVFARRAHGCLWGDNKESMRCLDHDNTVRRTKFKEG